ncbi:MAG: GNAT family N-acetyltransferase [Bacteriovoracaceae bacterium]|nr:GNAT family N-acetyltransferase [Bacteriovoracaceae bacterium]
MSVILKKELIINENVSSRLLTLEDAPELFKLVDSNRDYLREWLPWLDLNTEVKDSEEFIERCIKPFEEGKSFIHGIFFNDVMVGNGGFHSLDHANKKASIGYWLAENYTGNGIITSFCSKLIDYAMNELEMNRIEIMACPENRPSCAIAERLGLKFEGCKRNNELLYGKFVDHNIYSILKSEMN